MMERNIALMMALPTTMSAAMMTKCQHTKIFYEFEEEEGEGDGCNGVDYPTENNTHDILACNIITRAFIRIMSSSLYT